MLFNHKNQPVTVAKDMNSKTHPHVFARLTEKLIPSEPFHGKMFNIQTRARTKGI